MLVKTTREKLNEGIARFGGAAPHLLPLYRAVRDEGLALLIVEQGAKSRFWPMREKIGKGRPIVALLSDDLVTSKGPRAFHQKSIKRLFSDAFGMVLVAGAPYPTLYATAAGNSVLFGGLTVLVECTPETQDEWATFAKKQGCKTILAGCVTGKPVSGIHNPICLGDLGQFDGPIEETLQ